MAEMCSLFIGGREVITFTGLPLPPTSNNQYSMIRRGSKIFHVPSEQLRKFKDAMKQYPLRYATLYQESRKKAQEWKEKNSPLELRCVFYFHRNRLFTKDNRFKRLDVSNRLKASHDCLSEMLGIDDSSFFRIYAEKTFIDDDEMFSAEISPIF